MLHLFIFVYLLLYCLIPPLKNIAFFVADAHADPWWGLLVCGYFSYTVKCQNLNLICFWRPFKF